MGYVYLFFAIAFEVAGTLMLPISKNFTKPIPSIIIIVLYIFQTSYSEHNLNKTISACIVAQKQTSKSFDLKQSKKFCEEKIKNSRKD